MSLTAPKFDDTMLDYIQIIHDGHGPRCALAFFLGRQNYLNDTADLNTNDVEDFIIGFYTQYNNRFGVRY